MAHPPAVDEVFRARDVRNLQSPAARGLVDRGSPVCTHSLKGLVGAPLVPFCAPRLAIQRAIGARDRCASPRHRSAVLARPCAQRSPLIVRLGRTCETARDAVDSRTWLRACWCGWRRSGDAHHHGDGDYRGRSRRSVRGYGASAKPERREGFAAVRSGASGQDERLEHFLAPKVGAGEWWTPGPGARRCRYPGCMRHTCRGC